MEKNNKEDEKEIARELWKRVNKRLRELSDYKRKPNNEKLNKVAKNLRHTKRYFDDHSVEFDSDFQEKFKKLYSRGFQGSLGSQKDLIELYNLKEDFGEEVEKVVQRKNSEEHVAVKMLGTSKKATFIKSNINGQLELDGQDHRFIETKIGIPKIGFQQRGTDKNKNFSETTLGKIFIGIVILVVGGMLLGYFTNWFGFS